MDNKKITAKKELKSLLGFFSLLILISLLITLSSVFFFIWATFSLTIKICLTGVAGMLVFKFLHFIFKKSAEEIDEEMKQNAN